jgi:hypothetical protein
LAGLSQESVAAQLIARFTAFESSQGAVEGTSAAATSPFHGVVFYSNGWKVMDRSGFVQPKAVSPIKEHEAFVVFDEARCRYANHLTAVQPLSMYILLSIKKLLHHACNALQHVPASYCLCGR